jgi:hypothetical protein
MNGAIPLLLLNACKECTGTTLPLPFKFVKCLLLLWLEFKSCCLLFAGTKVKRCETIILPAYLGFSPADKMVDLEEENVENTVQ